jgi:hypothetical protein
MMFILERRVFGMKLGMIWFAPKLEDRRGYSKLVYVFPDSEIDLNGFELEVGYKMNPIDLSQSEESIFAQFHKTARREVRLAEKNLVSVEFNSNYGESMELMNDFFKRKKLKFPSKVSEKELKQCDHLLIEGRLKDKLVHVTYMGLHNKLATLIFTCSKDIGDEQHLASIVARFAHFEAMKKLKAEGFTRYGFGCCIGKLNDGTESYNAFKLSFGGQIIQAPSYTKTYNPLLRIGLSRGREYLNRVREDT